VQARSGRMRKWTMLALAVIVLDQITKYAVTRTLSLHEVIELTPFFNMVFVYNRGAAFSFLSDAAGWQRELFIAIALSASIWIAWLLRKYSQQTVFCVALSLILGGALGNVVDRLVYGAVVDFLDFHAAGYHWPAFNVADSAISCGAVLLIWDALRAKGTAAAV
jgi:signal peptidase II